MLKVHGNLSKIPLSQVSPVKPGLQPPLHAPVSCEHSFLQFMEQLYLHLSPYVPEGQTETNAIFLF